MYCINRRDRCRFCERGCALLKNIMFYTPQSSVFVFGGRWGVAGRAPAPGRTELTRVTAHTGRGEHVRGRCRLGCACEAESEMRRESVSEYTTVPFFLYTDERLHTCELSTVVRCVRRGQSHAPGVVHTGRSHFSLCASRTCVSH